MVKIVVASGKGGVGKSLLVSSLALLWAKSKKIVAVDADVDAPNLHLWLGGVKKWDEVKDISVLEKAVVAENKCFGCGKCEQICVFGAIKVRAKKAWVNELFCEGCGACQAVCPAKAISFKKVNSAQIKVSRSLFGFPLISAQLYPAETGSGKIVDRLKTKAEEFDYELMIIDAPAGTGCPVISALNGANLAVLVTEPTPSGFADLKRVLKVVNHFQIPWRLILNKWDINKKESGKIISFAKDNYLGKISYDQNIFKAIAALKPIASTNLPVKEEILKMSQGLLKLL